MRPCHAGTCQIIGLNTNTGTYVGNSSGTNVDRSGMQWLKLQISADATTLALADHGRFYDTNQTANPWWYYFPSIMVNCAGDMVAGFSGSTATTYASAFYTWRVSSGATLGQPRVIQPGTVTFAGTRWGEYSATSLDPTDDWNLWTVQQYATSVPLSGISVNKWSTRIAKVRAGP